MLVHLYTDLGTIVAAVLASRPSWHVASEADERLLRVVSSVQQQSRPCYGLVMGGLLKEQLPRHVSITPELRQAWQLKRVRITTVPCHPGRGHATETNSRARCRWLYLAAVCRQRHRPGLRARVWCCPAFRELASRPGPFGAMLPCTLLLSAA